RAPCRRKSVPLWLRMLQKLGGKEAGRPRKGAALRSESVKPEQGGLTGRHKGSAWIALEIPICPSSRDPGSDIRHSRLRDCSREYPQSEYSRRSNSPSPHG